MADPLLPILIQPVVENGTPTQENLVTYAFLTLVKIIAQETGKTVAQVQADFKAQWNADYPENPLT